MYYMYLYQDILLVFHSYIIEHDLTVEKYRKSTINFGKISVSIFSVNCIINMASLLIFNATNNDTFVLISNTIYYNSLIMVA